MLEVSVVGALERSVTRRWHDELVADPALHAWVLNLYRAGEHHPATVDDYFPVAHAPRGLAEKLAAHREEEAMHARVYAGAIRALEQDLVDHTGLDVFNIAIREHTPATFRILDDDAPDLVTRKIAHFLAHAHFLEARIAHSLELHANACARASSPALKAVSLVLTDEIEHTRYTREAVF
ncbi:MAG TPA: hypothetical protein VGO62_19355, partial [Myxococcota bacterium]